MLSASTENGRKDQVMTHGKTMVMIFEALSAAIEYSQLYLASLKVTYCGSTETFQDTAAVKQYTDSLDMTTVGKFWTDSQFVLLL